MKNSRRTITKGARKMEVHVAVRYDIGSPQCYLGRGGGGRGWTKASWLFSLHYINGKLQSFMRLA